MFTVFVGNNDQKLANAALAHDTSAYLLNSTTYNESENYSGTAYVSLADLIDVYQLNSILQRADVIVYISTSKWSDSNNNQIHSQQWWTERSLRIFSLDRNKSIINLPDATPILNSESMLELDDTRKTNDPQLWVVGCSITYGDGVNINQRYANLLSQSLDLDLSVIAFPGSSITWAADQLLRSDIRKNDIVVWGLTSRDRFPYYAQEQNKIIHINVAKYPEFNKTVDIKHLDDATSMYKNLTSIYQVVNYCRKIEAKLVVAGILLDFEFANCLTNLDEYIHLHNYYGVNKHDIYLDIGDDNDHPGPLMHQWYARQILGRIR